MEKVKSIKAKVASGSEALLKKAKEEAVRTRAASSRKRSPRRSLPVSARASLVAPAPA
jgi:hypothetical protein